MSIYGTNKENLKNISFDTDTNILTISWDTRGVENAICGLKLKVEFIDKIISNYKSPETTYNPNYNEAF